MAPRTRPVFLYAESPCNLDDQSSSKPSPAGYRVDETEYLRSPESDETLFDRYMTGPPASPQLNTTDTCSADDGLFSEFLRSPSPSSIGEFSGHSSDTAVDPVIDEAIPTPATKTPWDALDHGVVQAEGQSHAVKPIRIRLPVKPPPTRPSGTKIILRLKGPKLGKGARNGRKKA